MKDSVKANLMIFLIIAVVSFCISCAFASLTITEENDSYKLIPIQNDSFEPKYIDEVPTILPKIETNYTNITKNTTDNHTIEYINYTYRDWSDLEY
ncbi:MAG: hypothetical protein E7Z77_00990 [Methanobrevibacter sp.]|uniref:hypothetical protein n=1 Tax=Methanobrevibacter sp. TaxID=66852 RepID=UPI0025EB6570|nr:hypothetical protein [Methanobrevibacter sp.]MBE6507967.1 hypothetical protein [Methanobrevibacter sp.]